MRRYCFQQTPRNHYLSVGWFWICMLLGYSATLLSSDSTTQYNIMQNWVAHPNKLFSVLGNYNLDIGIINATNTLSTIKEVPNQSKTETGVDVFFIHPTVLDRYYPLEGTIAIDSQPIGQITSTVIAQAGQLAQFGRFYAPFYRQATQSAYLSKTSDSAQALAVLTAYEDIKNAFLYYLENNNQGNAIIIASHSQGSYLAAMLLRDVFDQNEALQKQLIVAALGGILCDFKDHNTQEPGWWESIPTCQHDTQSACVITWRCFKNRQTIPSMLQSHLALNPLFVENNVIKRTFNSQSDVFYQDSLSFMHFDDTLPLYIIPNGDQSYPGGRGFAAYNNRYLIKYERQGSTSIGWMLEAIEGDAEVRPDHLLELEQTSEFSLLGYHRRDYNIFIMRLVELIQTKLDHRNLSNPVIPAPIPNISIYPNPAHSTLNLSGEKSQISHQAYSIRTSPGKLIIKGFSDQEGRINIPQLKPGLYYIQVGTHHFKVQIQQ